MLCNHIVKKRLQDNQVCLILKILTYIFNILTYYCSSVGIATELRVGRSGIESRWGRDFLPVQTGPRAHPASCKMGTGSFPGGKVRPGHAADHSLTTSAMVLEEWSYTSTHPLGHAGPVTGSLYLFTKILLFINNINSWKSTVTYTSFKILYMHVRKRPPFILIIPSLHILY